MNRRIFSSLILFALMGAAASPARDIEAVDDQGVRSIFCYETQNPPRLDGLLDDVCWRDIDFSSNFYAMGDRSKRSRNIMVKVRHDGRNLYAALKAVDVDMARIKCAARARDNNVYEDDDFEIALDNDYDDTHVFQFIANAAGNQMDAKPIRDNSIAGYNANIEWNGNWTVAVSKTGSGWAAEFAIPFALLGVDRVKAGETWRINFTRHDTIRSVWYTWNYASGLSYYPWFSGRIVFKK